MLGSDPPTGSDGVYSWLDKLTSFQSKMLELKLINEFLEVNFLKHTNLIKLNIVDD